MVPLATTRITIRRPPATADLDPGTDPPPTPSVVASGVRAHIDNPSGAETPPAGGGEQSTTGYRLSADPCDLTHRDLIDDQSTGVTYRVEWATRRRGLGLDHMTGSLHLVEGAP